MLIKTNHPSIIGRNTTVLKLLIVTMVIFLSASASHAAPVLVTKNDFSLTYPDGWMNPGIAQGDSIYFLMSQASEGAVVSGSGIHIGPGINAAQYVKIVTMAYTKSAQRVDSTTKTIGAHSFSIATYTDTSIGGDTTSRVRVYVTSSGQFLFVSWVIYQNTAAAAVIAQQEMALASLKISVITGIGSLSVTLNPDSHRNGFDILGRNRLPFSRSIHRVSVYPK